MQTFTLRQSPLTYVSAPTVSGVETTLQVRVNDILWHEEESLAWLAPTDRNYITQADDENQTSIIFGNGERGARPSTGIENIKAVYRSGIGKPGNVKAKKLTSMPAKPLGVKEVVNPLEATGGADSESRDQARRNAPLAVMSLDRLVSVRDYEDFARTFAGIGKASAVRLTDGIRQVVHLTIAGADDIPISPTSDLFKNLYQSLHKFGDPYQPVKIAVRQLLVLAIVASVRLHPDYLWEVVEPKIRQALLDRLSFAERELGQDVLLSEVISAIQAVEGVVYVDVDKLDAIESDYLKGDLRSLFSLVQPKKRVTVKLAEINPDAKKAEDHIRPAQLAFLSPLVSETLTLTELKV
jgi:predicted phage baseplate assembly protein